MPGSPISFAKSAGGGSSGQGTPLPEWLAGTVPPRSGGPTFLLAQSPNGKVFFPQLPVRADLGVSTAGNPACCQALAFNGSEWLFAFQQVAGVGKKFLFRSTDGYSWTQIANPFSNADGDSITCLCWTGTKWFMGSRDASAADVIASSADHGLTWTLETTPFAGGFVIDMAWDGHNLVAAGCNAAVDGHGVMTSTGNGTWTAQPPPAGGFIDIGAGVCTNGTTWVVAVSEDSSLFTAMVASSADPTTWTGVTPFGTAGYGYPWKRPIVWDGTHFWIAQAINHDGGTQGADPQLAKSVDGTTWVDAGQPLGSLIAITAIGWDGTILVISGCAVGGVTGAVTAWSDDHGVTWNLEYPPDAYWSLVSKTQPQLIPPVI